MVVDEFWVLLLGVKKRKAWNKTREKYMPIKRRQNLAETDRASYYNVTLDFFYKQLYSIL